MKLDRPLVAHGLTDWVVRAHRVFPLRRVLHFTLPHRAVEMLAAYVLHRFTEGALHSRRQPVAVDLDARDEETVGLLLDAARAVGNVYFRADVRGVEHVPKNGPALLVGNHNGGFLTFDTYLTMAAIADAQGLSRAVRPLAHDFVFDDPVLRAYAMAFGSLRAGHEGAEQAFARGDLVLVYPGGDLDTFRPFSRRDRIELGGRSGFVRLALRNRVPIVPVVSAGTHEQMVILWRGDRIARLLGMHRWARAAVFPIALSLPWGLTSAFVPYLPLPAQTTVAFGPQLAWPELGPEAADDPEVVARCYQQVQNAMQSLLDGITAGRRPFLGLPRRRDDRAREAQPR